MSDEPPVPTPPPAGWYPEGGRQRYWDGQQWTEHWADYRADLAPAPKQSFWTTGRIIAAAVGGVVLVGVLGVVGLLAGGILFAGGFGPIEPTTKAEAVEMCEDFADDELTHADEAELSEVRTERVRKDYYIVRGTYTVHGGSGPLRCEVEFDPADENWYLDALTMPEEDAGPDQSVKIDVTED